MFCGISEVDGKLGIVTKFCSGECECMRVALMRVYVQAARSSMRCVRRDADVKVLI
jgi:hypothetical protein